MVVPRGHIDRHVEAETDRCHCEEVPIGAHSNQIELEPSLSVDPHSHECLEIILSDIIGYIMIYNEIITMIYNGPHYSRIEVVDILVDGWETLGSSEPLPI